MRNPERIYEDIPGYELLVTRYASRNPKYIYEDIPGHELLVTQLNRLLQLADEVR